jgi:hypothetical protein
MRAKTDQLQRTLRLGLAYAEVNSKKQADELVTPHTILIPDRVNPLRRHIFSNTKGLPDPRTPIKTGVIGVVLDRVSEKVIKSQDVESYAQRAKISQSSPAR